MAPISNWQEYFWPLKFLHNSVNGISSKNLILEGQWKQHRGICGIWPFLCPFQVRASSVPPPRELPTAPLIQRQRRGSIAPGAPASNVSSRLREREAEFARQVSNSHKNAPLYWIVCFVVQRYSSTLSQGFEDEDLGNFPGWWAATVATYCPSRPSQLLATTITKHCDRVDK